jgi:hypothetical protein
VSQSFDWDNLPPIEFAFAKNEIKKMKKPTSSSVDGPRKSSGIRQPNQKRGFGPKCVKANEMK